MSIRSIVEFNHDYTHKIEEDPEAFVAALGRYLGSASEITAEPLQIKYGMRIAWSGHHSSDRKVVTKYDETDL